MFNNYTNNACKQRISLFVIFLMILGISGNIQAKDVHVSINGDDMNSGTIHDPLRTINRAASLVQPGDVVIVHAGTYREWVKPQRGGASALQPVVFVAADGEQVYIKGSERITSWTDTGNGLWKAEIPVSFFGNYNPYVLKIYGAWLTYGINQYHRGGVFLNEYPLLERLTLDSMNLYKGSWYTETNDGQTSIWANFGDVNPNTALTEISVRECVFFPEQPWINYITVDGFNIMHSSENWSPPGSHQKGAVGANWGYGWVIKNCKISDAKCIGICVGSYPGLADKNVDINKFEKDIRPNFEDLKDRPEYKENPEAFKADFEKRSKIAIKALRERAPADMNRIGHHTIMNNEIRRCGQSGIAGEYGNRFSLVEGNLIEETNYSRQFGGWETAGIKFHAPVDVVIRNNCIHGVYGAPGEAAFGIWLDWEAQGTRISGNVISETDNVALYFEVSHGPILVDNNVIIGGGVKEHSQGGIFVNNLFYGGEFIFVKKENRVTPYYKSHSVDVTGYQGITMSDDKWYNNIFIGNGLHEMFEAPGYNSDYNIFLKGAEKSIYDTNSLSMEFDPGFEYIISKNLEISFTLNASILDFKCPLITYGLIGKVTLPGEGIEHHDGSPITIDCDYFANPRELYGKITAGPFIQMKEGTNNLILWPKN